MVVEQGMQGLVELEMCMGELGIDMNVKFI